MRALVACVLAGCSFHPGLGTTDGAARDSTALDAAAVDAAAPGDAGDWWNTSWALRLPITIANTSSDALGAGYQVGLAYAFSAAPCNSSGLDDVRIVYRGRELSRVIDVVAPAPWIWFPLATPLAANATSSGDYWLYCGNPAPPAAPADPTKVFDFYDGFDGATADAAVWTTYGTASISGGLLDCDGTNGDAGVVTMNEPFVAKHAVDFVAIDPAPNSTSWWAGFQNGTQDVAPWLHWYNAANNKVEPDFLGDGTAGEMPWYGMPHALDTSAHIYGVENYGTKSMYRYADVTYASHPYPPTHLPPANLDVRLWCNGTHVSYDWVRVRQAVDPPPMVSVGPAQPLD